MSVLSGSHYDQLMQAISLIKAQIEEDSKESVHNYELISLKLKLAEQQTEESTQAMRKYQKQTNHKINNFSAQTKQMLKQIIQAYPKNEGIETMQRQLKDLLTCRDKMIKSTAHSNSNVVQSLQAEINEFEKRFKERKEENAREIKEIQQQMKKEIELTRKKLDASKQLLDEQRLLQNLQQLYQQLSGEISELRKKRKERKQHFLNLLQAIVLKCKQKNQTDQ